MKLNNIRVGEFIALLEKAKGNIYLDTGDGVYFNLSSKLSQLYCIKMLLSGSKDSIISPVIKIEDEGDKLMFEKILVNHYRKCRNQVR
ncbi:MAG TPA: hypothetical protein VHP54_00070 [Caproiciproducens sp.]|jgi:hypothetical protein|nr:hypothetical protein [Caproiciproducens sp.]